MGLLGLSATLPAEEAQWRIGLASVRITPEGPLPMCGYGACMSDGVLDELHAKAMAIELPGGERAVLVTADLLFFRAPVAEAVCRRIMAGTGLKRHQILLNASHTHSGPIVGINSDLDLFGVPQPARVRVAAYTEKLEEQLQGVAVAALADLRPARLFWGAGKADFVANRRRMVNARIVMAPNPSGPVDRTVPVLRIDSPEGQLRAILFGCACHNVTLDGQNRKISGDFASFAQLEIEGRHPGVQAMFVAGCGGDANPNPRGGSKQEDLVRGHGRRLAEEVCRVAGERLPLVRGPLQVRLQWTALPLECALPRERLQKLAAQTALHARNVRAMLDVMDRHGQLPTHYRAPVALWQFGSDLTLVGLPGEAVAEYVPLIQQALGPDRLWIAAYCNESFGYLPTRKILVEGGHESMGLTLDYGFFSPDVEDVVVAAVRQLAGEAKRPLGR